jgi:competence protein ComFC
MKKIQDGLLSLFFPTTCAACGRYIKDFAYLYVCPECYDGIKRLEGNLCVVCMKPLQADYLNKCRECEGQKRYFACVAPAGVYDGALKGMIHQLKFYNKKKLAKVLADFMLDNIMDTAVKWADVLVPVPLSKKVMAERGYNQTALVAKILAGRFGKEMSGAVIKIRETEPQNKLEREQRLKNLKGAFEAKEGVCVTGRKVLVVDDVYTTGATMNEMAKILIKAGAK